VEIMDDEAQEKIDRHMHGLRFESMEVGWRRTADNRSTRFRAAAKAADFVAKPGSCSLWAGESRRSVTTN
jgi:hypothetical protein